MLTSDWDGRGHDMMWPYYCRVPAQGFQQLGLACDKSSFLESVPVQLSQHSGDTRFPAIIRLHESRRQRWIFSRRATSFWRCGSQTAAAYSVLDLTRLSALYAVSFSDSGHELMLQHRKLRQRVALPETLAMCLDHDKSKSCSIPK